MVIDEDANDDGLISDTELVGDVNVTVTLPGDAVAGDTLTITDGVNSQDILLSATDITNGTVSATVPAPAADGLLTVTANVTDAAGNAGPDGTDAATVDTGAPSAPTVVIDEDANDDGVVGTDELDGDIDVTVGLPEGAAVGDTLTITDGITPQTVVLTEEDIANGSVGVSFAPPADGTELDISATLTDAAGNTSPDSSDDAAIDTEAPAAPTVTIDEDANDDGVVGTDELDGDIDVTVGLPEGAAVGDTLTITDGTTPQTVVLTEEDIANGSVGVSFAPPADGTELAISATLTDAAGNTSPDSSDDAAIDTEAPAAPTVTIDEDANDDGVVGTDELDGDIDVTIGLPEGAAVGDTLTITDGTTPQTVVLTEEDIANGSVGVSFAPPADGTELAISATLTDAAGNTSPEGALDGSDDATIDTEAPAAPTVTIDEDANDDGVVGTDELDGDIDVTIGLPAGAAVGDTLTITDGTTPQTVVLTEEDIANGSVGVSFAPPADGTELDISATLTDAAGNTSPDSSDDAAIDTEAPAAPTVTIDEDANDDGVVGTDELDGDIDVTVGLPVGAAVGDTLTITDGITPQTVVLTEEDISIGSVAAVFAPPADGTELTVSATLTDAAGNTSPDGIDDTTIALEAMVAPPDIDIATFVVLENTSTVTVLSASDPDAGDVLSFSITGGDDAAAFSIDPATGELSFIAPPDFENPSDIDGDNVFDLEITVTDSTGLTDLLDATVTVTDIPEDDVDDSDPGQPNAVDDLINIPAGQAIAIDVLANDTDPDGDPLTITAVTQPAQGTAEIDDNGTPDDPSDDFIVFTPAAGAGADDLSLAQSEAEAGILQLGGDFAAFTDSFTVTVADPDGNTASSTVEATVEAQAMLEFALLGSDALCHNEVGVYVTDDAAGTINGIAPGEAGYAEAALSSGQVIFSAMPGVTELFGEAPNRILDGFSASDNLGFFLIQNDTVDSVLLDIESGNESAEVFFAPVAANSDGAEHASVSALESGNGFTVAFEDQLGGGDGDFNDLIFSVELTDEAPLLGTEFQGGREGELLSLLGSGPVTAEFVAESDAAFDNTVGFYVIDDISGAIAGADGALLSPEDAGYAEAAVANAVTVFGEEGTTVDLAGDVLLAPFLIADGTVADFQAGSADAFFAFLGANPDGIDHIRLLGDNTFGFEDMLGGGDGDFNDFVLQANFA